MTDNQKLIDAVERVIELAKRFVSDHPDLVENEKFERYGQNEQDCLTLRQELLTRSTLPPVEDKGLLPEFKIGEGDAVLRILSNILKRLQYQHEDLPIKSCSLIADISELETAIKLLNNGYVCAQPQAVAGGDLCGLKFEIAAHIGNGNHTDVSGEDMLLIGKVVDYLKSRNHIPQPEAAKVEALDDRIKEAFAWADNYEANLRQCNKGREYSEHDFKCLRSILTIKKILIAASPAVADKE